jgi:carbonic anhydrase/acetyltransferase-like protein (isoleucine patch superfamily)
MDWVAQNDTKPVIAKGAYVDPKAILIGEVIVEEGAGIWPGAVIRADDAMIVIKRGAMILGNAVIVAVKGRSIVIGSRTIIGHGAIIHGADIGEKSIIGIGAIVLEEALIWDHVLIGSGALVSPRKVIPSGKVVVGVPGKVVKDLTPKELEFYALEWKTLAQKVFQDDR